jgi:hypothetical protein
MKKDDIYDYAHQDILLLDMKLRNLKDQIDNVTPFFCFYSIKCRFYLKILRFILNRKPVWVVK